MTEQAITKTQIIVVQEVGANTYGDLTFTDKAGGDYKVSVKRKQYFEKVIIPGMAVQLNYAMSSFGKEYIYYSNKYRGNNYSRNNYNCTIFKIFSGGPDNFF